MLLLIQNQKSKESLVLYRHNEIKRDSLKKVSETGSHHHIDFHSDISDNNNVAANS